MYIIDDAIIYSRYINTEFMRVSKSSSFNQLLYSNKEIKKYLKDYLYLILLGKDIY